MGLPREKKFLVITSTKGIETYLNFFHKGIPRFPQQLYNRNITNVSVSHVMCQTTV